MFAYCGNNPILYADHLGNRFVYCVPKAIVYDGTLAKDSQQKRDVTEELENALFDAAVSARKHSSFVKFLLGDNLASMGMIYLGFYNAVNHKQPWDIKRSESWQNTIGTPFPGVGVYVLFNGISMTPEQLGNFSYGFLGFAYGIPYEHLLGGSYYAAGFPTESAQLANEFFDWFFIKLGYVAAEEAFQGGTQ